MAYKPEEIEEKFDIILSNIRKGSSLRTALNEFGMPNADTFYKWIESDTTKAERYARACEDRADIIFDEIIQIADDSSGDIKVNDKGQEMMDSEFVQRSRLRVDARKWIVSKLNPKKYGDRMEVDNKLSGAVTMISLGSGQKPDESNS